MYYVILEIIFWKSDKHRAEKHAHKWIIVQYTLSYSLDSRQDFFVKVKCDGSFYVAIWLITGCPDIWLNIISRYVCEVSWRKLAF